MFTVRDAHDVDHWAWLSLRSLKIKGCAGAARILEEISRDQTQSLNPFHDRMRSCPTGKSLRLIRIHVKPSWKKYFSSVFQKYMVLSSRPASLRGVRVVTNVEAGYDGRFGFARRARHEADGKIAWSWPPDAEVK